MRSRAGQRNGGSMMLCTSEGSNDEGRRMSVSER